MVTADQKLSDLTGGLVMFGSAQSAAARVSPWNLAAPRYSSVFKLFADFKPRCEEWQMFEPLSTPGNPSSRPNPTVFVIDASSFDWQTGWGWPRRRQNVMTSLLTSVPRV